MSENAPSPKPFVVPQFTPKDYSAFFTAGTLVYSRVRLTVLTYPQERYAACLSLDASPFILQ